jgi:hypothetical protein
MHVDFPSEVKQILQSFYLLIEQEKGVKVLTQTTEESPSGKSDSRSADENLAFHGTRRFTAIVHKSFPMNPLISQLNRVHELTP